MKEERRWSDWWRAACVFRGTVTRASCFRLHPAGRGGAGPPLAIGQTVIVRIEPHRRILVR